MRMTVRFRIRADTTFIPGVGVLTKTGAGYWSDWITTDAPLELLKPHEHADPDSPDRARMPGKVAYVARVETEPNLAALLAVPVPHTRTVLVDEDGLSADVFHEDTPVTGTHSPQPKKRSKR